ncbi:unnamed protein product [Parajaminaea phylloscopi]
MSDVKLPPIRSIGGFSDRPLASAPPSAPLEHSNSTSPGTSIRAAPQYSRMNHSPSSQSSRFPSLAHYASESRSRPEIRPLTDHANDAHEQAHQQRVARFPERPNLHSVETCDRPIAPSPSRAVVPSSTPATPFHPFFDAGRKDAAGSSRQDLERATAQWKTTLFQAAHYLDVAKKLIGDGLDNYSGTDDASLDVVNTARQYAAHAWQMLNNVLERAGDPPSRLESSRPELAESSHAPSWSEDQAVTSRASGPMPSQHGSSSSRTASSQQASSSFDRSRSSLPAYAAYNKESHEPQARPPVDIMFVNGYRRPSHEPSGSPVPRPSNQDITGESEPERSYMYAPASIRNRLAAMQRSSREASSAHRDGNARSHAPSDHASRWPESPPRAFGPLGSEHSGGYTPLHEQSFPSPYPRGSYDDDRMGPYSPAEGGGTSKYKKRSRAPAPSACNNCGTNETPEWRRGPGGARTLCNACGLHFAKMVKKKGTYADGSVHDEQHRHSTSSAAAVAAGSGPMSGYGPGPGVGQSHGSLSAPGTAGHLGSSMSVMSLPSEQSRGWGTVDD